MTDVDEAAAGRLAARLEQSGFVVMKGAGERLLSAP
jgi:hypothetical protein